MSNAKFEEALSAIWDDLERPDHPYGKFVEYKRKRREEKGAKGKAA